MIQIETVKGQIAIRTTPGRQTIEQPKADFSIDTKASKVLMEREPLQIRIDQSPCFNESGLMNNKAFSDDSTGQAIQAHLEGIARVVSEGNQMAQIENRANMISEIALSNSFDIREYDLGTMPRSKPDIQFIGGTMDIKIDEGYVQVNSKPNAPRIEYEVGSVETTLSRQPSISIRYIGENIDKSV